jgi:Transcriptional regulators
MDNTDIKILNCLSANARANASEIAEKVKLSTSAVIERIKKLENSDTILGYTVILNPQKLNKDVIAMMSVAIDHPKFNDGFVEAVMQNHHITECLYIAGDFDYLLKVITDNTQMLEGVLNEIKSIPGVSKTKTNIVLSSPKNEYSIPLRVKTK